LVLARCFIIHRLYSQRVVSSAEIGVNSRTPLPIDTHSGRVDTDRTTPSDILDSARQIRWHQVTQTRKERVPFYTRRYSRHPHSAHEIRRSSHCSRIKRHARVRHRKRPKIRACDGLISKRDRHRSRGQMVRFEHTVEPNVIAAMDRKVVKVRLNRC